MTTHTITILAGRLGEAQAAAKKLRKRAARYDVPFSISFGPVRQEERTQESRFEGHRPRKIFVDVIDATIEGETPKVGDYEFLASIERTPGGNFVDTAPGIKIDPAYRDADSSCGHCRTSRQRKHVYALRNRETGEEVQVGRRCLRDYFGLDDPKHIIGQFRFWRLVLGGSDGDGFESFGLAPWTTDIVYALALTSAAIRIWGWTSKGQARDDDSMTPTVGRVMSIWGRDDYSAREAEEIYDEMKESDEELALEVVEWVRSSQETSDYMHNLRVAFSDDLLYDERRMGLAISAVASFGWARERYLKRAEKRKRNVGSTHVGKIGDRLRDLAVELIETRGMGEGQWGWTTMYKFLSDDGNVFTWFTGKELRRDIGESMTIRGRVKEHKTYAGIDETLLTRVTVK